MELSRVLKSETAMRAEFYDAFRAYAETQFWRLQ